MKKNLYKICLAFILCGCSNPTEKMSFKSDIKLYDDRRVVLSTTTRNFSDQEKTLDEITISKEIHELLKLSKDNYSDGEYDSLNREYIYYIKRKLSPGESVQVNFYGTKVNDFVSGEVDFIVNNDYFNFRTNQIDCCE